MTSDEQLPPRSRLLLLLGVVGVLIAVSVVAIVVVTSRPSASSAAPDRGERALGTPAASGAVTFAPASSKTSAPKTSAPKTSAPKTSAPTSSTPKSTSGQQPVAARKPITYTVKKGDNLTVIAAWFKLHGYGKLYEQNKSVIGSDPDLIVPGQRITVSSRGMTVSRNG